MYTAKRQTQLQRQHIQGNVPFLCMQQCRYRKPNSTMENSDHKQQHAHIQFWTSAIQNLRILLFKTLIIKYFIPIFFQKKFQYKL